MRAGSIRLQRECQTGVFWVTLVLLLSVWIFRIVFCSVEGDPNLSYSSLTKCLYSLFYSLVSKASVTILKMQNFNMPPAKYLKWFRRHAFRTVEFLQFDTLV